MHSSLLTASVFNVCIDGGAKYGEDLFVFLFLFTFLAYLCKYLSKRIVLVRKRNLAQICCIEYGKVNSIFLGTQAEAAMLMSDLAMVICMANGFHAILGVSLSSAVMLAALDTTSYPFPSFWLRFRRSSGETRTRVAYYNLHNIFAICGGIFLFEHMLMNSATELLDSSIGLAPYTFVDAMSLIAQSFGSPNWHLVFSLLITSSHFSGLFGDTIGEGRQKMLYDIFRIDIPCWLHRVVIRIFAITLALCSQWYSGAEGMYNLLILSQITVALLLPTSVVSLYRIASSRALMGANTISPAIEFFMFISSMVIIGLQLVLLGKMVFIDVSCLGHTILPHSILLLSGCTYLFFTYRLLLKPLTTAVRRSNTQSHNHDLRERRVTVNHRVPRAEEQGQITMTDDESVLYLTRSSRSQVVAILDDFWSQLYDCHGQFTLAERAKRLHVNQSRSWSDESEKKLLESLRRCILKLMRVRGSKWLFRRTNVEDEEVVRNVAAKERYMYKSNPDHDDIDFSAPHCGERCLWNVDLIVCFGVWCIHRILELSMEDHYPELWENYAYFLYRLRGVIDAAFLEERNPTPVCMCLEVEPGKMMSAPMLMEIVKDTETFIFGKKDESSNEAPLSMDIENLLSVLLHYKLHLSKMPSNPRV